MGLGRDLIRLLRTGLFLGALVSGGLGLNERYRAAGSIIRYNELGRGGIERVLEGNSGNMNLSYGIGLYHFDNAKPYFVVSGGLLLSGLLLSRYKKR